MLEQMSVCTICGNHQTKLYPFGQQPFILHCQGCATETLWPLPTDEEIRQYYSSYPTTKTSEQAVLYLINIARRGLQFYFEKMGYSAESKTELNFLEIGFGNAASLFAAARFGFKAHGIDLDPEPVVRAREFAQQNAIPIVVACGDVSELPGMQSRFHIVKASHVLEHVKDPHGFLGAISRVQQAGDYLIIECPNNQAGFWWCKNAVREIFDRTNFYNSLKITEHLWGYNKKSLPLLLKQAGYEIRFLTDYAVGDAVFQPETLVWYPSLSHGFRRVLKQRSWRPLIYPGARVLDSAFSRLLRRGTGLAALCQKTSQ